MQRFTRPTFVPLESGYEVVCAENEFSDGKLTGFTNHRFGITKRDGQLWFLTISGKPVAVDSITAYREALKRELPTMEAICPPLAESASNFIRNL